MKKTLFLIALFFMASINFSLAVEVSSFKATYTVQKDLVDTLLNIRVSSNGNSTFFIEVPRDADINYVMLDDYVISHIEKQMGTKKSISFNLMQQESEIKIQFSTRSFLDKGKQTYFVSEIKNPYFTKEIYATLILPEGAILNGNESVFPKATINTLGKKNNILWWKKNLKENDSFSMMAIYIDEETAFWTYVLAGALILALFFTAWFLFKFFKRNNLKTKTPKNSINAIDSKFQESRAISKDEIIQSRSEIKDERKDEIRDERKDERIQSAQKKEKEFYSHLKEEEQQIVNILKDREGHIEQGTLVIITGFSKAHLSRLLAELEDRKIIYKENKGKKNVIWLK